MKITREQNKVLYKMNRMSYDNAYKYQKERTDTWVNSHGKDIRGYKISKIGLTAIDKYGYELGNFLSIFKLSKHYF